MGKTLKLSTIEYIDYSWNPTVGCKHGCPYCYAKEISSRFPNQFPISFEDPYINLDPKKFDWRAKPKGMIFVGSMSDIFGEWDYRILNSDQRMDRKDVITKVLDTCRNRPENKFLFLTKNPKGMRGFNFDDNFWTGTTITCVDDMYRAEDLGRVKSKVKYISFEPLLDRIPEEELDKLPESINWVILGPNSKNNTPVVPVEYFHEIIQWANKRKIPVFCKDKFYGKYGKYAGQRKRNFPIPKIEVLESPKKR